MILEKTKAEKDIMKEVMNYQRNFLINLGIEQRAEILSKNLPFSKKADIYYRLNRLVNKNQMGNLFKVMFVTNKKNKFKLGF